MTAVPRGVCVIINNEIFDNPEDNRDGTNVDADALEKMFSKFSFSVEVHRNKTARQMEEILQKVHKSDHSKYDCLVVAILTHGRKDDDLSGTDHNYISLNELMSSVDGKQCPSLRGKPKIFIVQACRGGQMDTGVKYVVSDTATVDKTGLL